MAESGAVVSLSGGVPAEDGVFGSFELVVETVVLGSHETPVEEDPASVLRVAFREYGPRFRVAEDAVVQREVSVALC